MFTFLESAPARAVPILPSNHTSLLHSLISADVSLRAACSPVPSPLFSPLLWEDTKAHRGPVVALHRVREAPEKPPTTPRACPAGAPPPPPPRRAREWIVSVGRGGEVRVWKVPLRWRCAGTAAQQMGLEFCATLLTNASVCSFSCALLSADSECAEDGWKEPRQGRERGWAPSPGQRDRLCCVVGADTGFVQAWEISLDGEEGVGGQPVWAQKVLTPGRYLS